MLARTHVRMYVRTCACTYVRAQATHIHTTMTRHEFAKKCLKYNLPHIINDTPELVLEKNITHSLRGFAYYLKMYLLQKYQNV